jgi:hypothetical protein
MTIDLWMLVATALLTSQPHHRRPPRVPRRNGAARRGLSSCVQFDFARNDSAVFFRTSAL